MITSNVVLVEMVEFFIFDDVSKIGYSKSS